MEMDRITPEEAKKWIMDFHRFRINSIFTENQKEKIWKNLCKYIMNRGLSFENTGFYEYKFYETDYKGKK